MGIEATPPPPLMTREGAPARALWGLDKSVAHLNHGSYGAAPRSTVALRAQLLEEVEANPLRWHLSVGERRVQARAEVAKFVGADPAQLAFVPNASAGTTAVLRELVAAGDVVITDHAYGALAAHVRREAARSGVGVTVAHVPLEADAAEAASAILDAMTPRTRLVVIDHISSGSATNLH